MDVDLPDLMLKKNSIVRNTEELRSLLPELQPDENSVPVMLKSKHYYQVGCDIRQHQLLLDILSSIFDPSASKILWVADSSLAFLEPVEADELISAASAFASGRLSNRCPETGMMRVV